jgi:hypothetical protein
MRIHLLSNFLKMYDVRKLDLFPFSGKEAPKDVDPFD